MWLGDKRDGRKFRGPAHYTGVFPYIVLAPSERTTKATEPAPATAEHFALANGCRPPRETQPLPGVTSSYYDGDYPVELWTMEGLGHVIPSSKETPASIGPNTDSFNAVDKVRDFFGLGDA